MDIKELPWAALPLEHTLYGSLIWMEQEYGSSSTAKFIDQQLIRQLQNARHREPFGHMEPIDVAYPSRHY